MNYLIGKKVNKMNKDYLQRAKDLLELYFCDKIIDFNEGYDFVNENDLKRIQEDKDFIKSLDFKLVKREVLKNIDTELAEIKGALKD